ncbi:MAG: 16S rRNA (guanine(527)-N(7))-methyltransferase RsmG [Nitrospira sp.]|nr:16S rRNA (guanine(527)-N(7))-methyltransferase RsmG [Nitrospira sp.]
MEQRGALEQLLHESASEIGVAIEPVHAQLFLQYLKQLKIWNQSFNLTAITKDEEVIVKHFIDSLAALKAVNLGTEAHVLDIGTGAGFPGIPLKIVRPDLYMTLIEPAHKKSAFLYFIVGLLRLKNVDVFQGTIERFNCRRHAVITYDYLTTRALNPSLIFHTAQHLLNAGVKAIIYSARPLDRTLVPNDWNFVGDYTFELPHAHGPRTISTFSHRVDLSSHVVPRGT